MKIITTSILKWILRVTISLWIVTIFFLSPGVNGYDRAEFGDLVYGRAWRPFVTRALFPAIVRITSQAIPSSFDSAVQNSSVGSRILSSPYVKDGLEWQPPFLREYLVAFLLTVACVVLLSLVMQKLWEEMYTTPKPHGYAFSILGLLGLPVLFKYHSYIYDFPSLLLYASCILMMARRRWGLYFILFGLSSLSKETTALLILIFAIYFIRSAAVERRTYWNFIAIQSLILIAARAGMAWIFRENPGSVVEFHFFNHNLKILTDPWSLNTLVAWGVVAALFFHGYRQKPYLLRVAASMLIPLLSFCVLFGLIDELRDYYEVYVPIALLVGYTITRLLGYPIEAAVPTDASGVRRIRTDAEPVR
jgi:hypothetical protein